MTVSTQSGSGQRVCLVPLGMGGVCLALAAAIGMIGCASSTAGSGAGSGAGGTAAGTYSFTVTATSGSAQGSAAYMLTVQ